MSNHLPVRLGTGRDFRSPQSLIAQRLPRPPGQHAREANEEIENYIVTWPEALSMIDRGDIQDGKTIVALLVWARRRENGR